MSIYAYIGILALVFIAIGLGIYLILISNAARVKQGVTEYLEERDRDFKNAVKNRYVRDHINIKAARMLDNNYKYSRFYKTKIGSKINTSYSYFLIALFVSLLFGILSFVATKDFFSCFMSIAFVFSMFYMYLYLLRVKHNKATNKELPLFLNLLGNYSTANSEITSIMLQIAPRMAEPLSSCLMEFVAEAQNTTKGKVQALENLANKIDNEKFREIIYSIVLAEKYDGSFKNVAVFNKRTVNDYLVSKKKKMHLVSENAIVFTICIIMIFLSFLVVGQILGISVFAEMVSTILGRIVLGVVTGCAIFFAYKLMEAGL